MSLTSSSATTATTAPKFYTDYITDIAAKGTAAGAAVPTAAWDPTANQTAAFTNVAANVGNYKPGLETAGSTFTKAGNTDITGAVNPYLTAGTTTSGLTQANPYFTSGTTTSGSTDANPYFTSGTATSGFTKGDPYLTAGTKTSGLSVADPYLTSGASSAADLVGGYMNPYTQNVVDQIRLANQQNIQQNLSPGITAGAVGGGQFGSSRGANALALGLSNANIGALGLQSKALQEGYAEAMKQAQQQRINQLNAGKTAGDLQTSFNTNQVNAGQVAGNLQNTANANLINAGTSAGNIRNTSNANLINAGTSAGTLQNAYNTNQVQAGQVAGRAAADEGQLLRDVGTAQANLASQTQKQGLADVDALATLGEQEQTIAKNKAMMPLDVLTKQAGVMAGAQLPMTTTQTMTASPLSVISGLGSLGMGMFTPGVGGSTPMQNIMKQFGGSSTGQPMDLGGGIVMNPDGTIVDLSGGGATGGGGNETSGDWQQDENGDWYDAGDLDTSDINWDEV